MVDGRRSHYTRGSMQRLGCLFLLAGALWAQTYHVTDLGTLTGTSSFANGISSNGTYVTGYFRSGAISHAFLYGPGGATDLGTLTGSGTSFAYGVNNNGQVAGYSAVTSGNHAFLYSGGTMTDLGTINGGASSMGYGINNSARRRLTSVRQSYATQ